MQNSMPMKKIQIDSFGSRSSTRTRDTASGTEWNSITNIGYRPTFGASDELTIETFLLDPFLPPPPAHIRVEFLRRVRAERKFTSPEELKTQILRDVRVAQAFFRRVKAWMGRECTSS